MKHNTFKLGEMINIGFNQFKVGSQVSLKAYNGFLGHVVDVKYGTKGYAYNVRWTEKPKDKWPPYDKNGYIFEFHLRGFFDGNDVMKGLLES